MRAGVALTFLVVAVLAVYPELPGRGTVRAGLYWPLIGAATVGALIVGLLPWARLLRVPAGALLLYAWSVTDIVLISVCVYGTGGATSRLFWLYSLTTVFSAVTCYPFRAQLGLLAFTYASYLAAALAAPAPLTPATAFLALSLLGLVMGMSSFLSLEMARQVRLQREAAQESATRATLLAMVAAAARSMTTVELDRVLDTVIESALGLGFEASEICLYNGDAGTWVTARSKGLVDYALEHPIDTGIAGLVWQRRASVTIADYAAWSGGVETVRRAGFRTVVAVPVWSEGEVTGALITGHHRREATPPYLTECLELLAAQAGAALDTARRFAERNRFEAEIAYRASHDALTDLPNRALFAELQLQARATARRSGRPGAVLLLDLDRFKAVNDSLGHDAGDRLLVEVAQRLKAALPPGDVIARYGGDEFAVLLSDLPGVADAALVADTLLEALRPPVNVAGADVYTSASIGIAYLRPGTPRVSDAVREAELAMYRAKEHGKGRWEVFESEMGARAVRRLEMETELRRALDAGELCLAYQPVANLDSGRVVAVEALLRWRHRHLGMVGPDDFVPLAEETGLIIPIGDWVLHQACAQARSWERGGAAPLQVAVNLSGRQFRSRRLVERVQQVLDETGLPPARLTLEITETVAMEDLQVTMQTVGDLAQLGVGIALDDFGQGSSSLGALRRFPLHSVKVDKVFVAGVSDDGPDRAIVSSVMTLAGSLGITVTAEGIETPGQLHALRELNCHTGQGYYLSKPLDAEAVPAALVRVTDRLRSPALPTR